MDTQALLWTIDSGGLSSEGRSNERTMRKLAAEAGFFGFLGLLLATLGLYAKVEADARRAARTEAAQAVHARDYQLPGAEPSNAIVAMTLDDGTILYVRRCQKYDPKTTYEYADRLLAALEARELRRKGAAQPSFNARPRNDAPLPTADETLDCRNFSFAPIDRASLERDYWAAYRDSKHQTLARTAVGSLAKGLLGFPAGLGVWIFYRRARFAGATSPTEVR
jgi:hypothetical protein